MKNKPMTETANSTPNVSSRSHLGERVPKLRFPGFEGEWEESSLRHFFTKNNDRNKDCYIKNVITNSAEYGLVSQSDFFDKSIAIEENTGNYYIIRRGNFVYNPRKSKTAPFGPFNRYEKNEVGIVSPLYTCLVPMPGINTDYLAWFFRSTVWHRYVYDNGSQGARHDRVNMTDDLLFQIPIRYPKSSEQTQVADFLSLINSRIAAQRKLVELLKKHKRGLLREVFEECAEGVRRAFCEIASRRTEKISPSNDSSLDCIELEHIEPDTGLILGTVPLREQSSLKNRCRPNDIIFGKLRPYLRKFVFAESECAASSETWVLTAASGINPRFLFYLIQSEPFMRVANISSGTKMPRSEWHNVANAQFAIPSQSRQQTIADCFTAIDMRIQDAQKTFLAIQAYKRGLLQQLFV